MNVKQLALIKKDIRSITSNKQVLMVILMVPLTLTLVLPSIMVFVTVLVPESTSDFQRLLNMLPIPAGEHDQEQMILGLMLNKIMPAFFLMIPVMASSVMAASSFVGEKEKHTLETLLYSPLSFEEGINAINDYLASEGGSGGSGTLDAADKEGADGKVSMAVLKEMLPWCKSETSYDMTYEEIAAKFGVHGASIESLFEGKTIYRWGSDDDNYIQITFDLHEDGSETWNVTQWNGID